ncbi:hypothetical protein ACIBG8_23120 [Nonomuraea sp. NPDC050556]|uniref:hypothetical protein n=1 Tax=Nonomuraea sp. NPDC050556 TaxID=3364369 RepID=UPI00379D54FE
MSLEDDLRRTLGYAAGQAPQAPADLKDHVVRRSKRRKARGTALLAAAAVVIVAGGAAFAVRTAGQQDRAAVPAPTEIGIEKVWPHAVWKIPAKLPGIKRYQPRRFIDDHSVLLETADAIYACDLETGQVRKIAAIPTPDANEFTIGAGRVVWQTFGGRSRFWSVPLEGGEPAEIRTDKPIDGMADELEVVGEKLAFSLFDGGVFTVPLTGGEVDPIKGAERDHLMAWPWVGTSREYAPNVETTFAEIHNVETGERSKAVIHPGDRYVRCSRKTCTGLAAGKKPFIRQRDGSRQRELPQAPTMGIAADRFMTVWRDGRNGQELLDLSTGRRGDLGIRRDTPKGPPVSVHPGLGDGRMMAYPLKDTYVIIDLSKI